MSDNSIAALPSRSATQPLPPALPPAPAAAPEPKPQGVSIYVSAIGAYDAALTPNGAAVVGIAAGLQLPEKYKHLSVGAAMAGTFQASGHQADGTLEQIEVSADTLKDDGSAGIGAAGRVSFGLSQTHLTAANAAGYLIAAQDVTGEHAQLWLGARAKVGNAQFELGPTVTAYQNSQATRLSPDGQETPTGLVLGLGAQARVTWHF